MWTIPATILALLLFLAYGTFADLPEWGKRSLWFLGGAVLVGGIWLTISQYKPSAMDVYQGKTYMLYTMQDSVAVDSVVVYKPKHYYNIKSYGE